MKILPILTPNTTKSYFKKAPLNKSSHDFRSINFGNNFGAKSFLKGLNRKSNFKNSRKSNITSFLDFCRTSLHEDKYSYNSFIKAAKRSGIKTQEDLIANVKPENLIGTGATSRVYKFNNKKLDKWVLKETTAGILNNPQGLFQKVEDIFGECNMGQEIAISGKRYSILKKIVGTPHSIFDWSGTIRKGGYVTREDSLEFLDSLNKIQAFPQSSFDKYAFDLKMIGEKGFKQDSINPNNLLIDYKKQIIHIIDFFEPTDPSHVDSKYDLTSSLLDFSLFGCFYEKLNKDEQKQLITSANNIIKKCTISSQKAGIRQDEKTYLAYLKNVDKWFGEYLLDKGGNYMTRYNLMKKLLERNPI